MAKQAAVGPILQAKGGEGLTLDVFVDGNLIEVVANGRASVAAVAGSAANASAVAVFGACGSGASSFDAWELDSIWD